MIGWLIDALVMSVGGSTPPRPRSEGEAQWRFVLRAMWLLVGLASAVIGAAVAFMSSQSVVSGIAILVAMLGMMNVVFGIPRLLALYRFRHSVSRTEPSDDH